jgi:hypothetical protein
VLEEEEIFHLLGMPLVEPVDRTQEAARQLLKRLGRHGRPGDLVNDMDLEVQ